MALVSKETLYQQILKRKLDAYAKQLEAELASLPVKPVAPAKQTPNRIQQPVERKRWDMSEKIGAAPPLHTSNTTEAPKTLKERMSGLGRALGTVAKTIGKAGLLTGVLHAGMVGAELAPNFMKVMKVGSEAVEARDPLVSAAMKIPNIKNAESFAKDIRAASELPDVKLPADIAGKDPSTLTPEQNRLRLQAQNQFTLDVYKSGDENQFINRFDDLDRILNDKGELNPNFISGVQRYAPDFAKKHGLDSYEVGGVNGKLDSVNKDLQAIYNKAVEYHGGKTPIVTEGNRTAEYQHSLYQKDRFKDGKFQDVKGQATTYADGFISPSDHQGANAIDIVIPGKAQDKASGADKVYGKFNESMQKAAKDLYGDKYDVEWGGNFVNDDYGHFALKEKAISNQTVQSPSTKQDLSLMGSVKQAWNEYNLLESNNPLSRLINSDTFLRQAYTRKIAPMIGQEKADPTIQSAFANATSNSKSIEIKNTHKDTQDVMNLGDRVYHSQILDLDNVKIGVRNRGDYTPIQSSTGIVGTTFEGFVRPQEKFMKTAESGKQTVIPKKDDMGVIGVDDKGNFVKGVYGDFKNRTDVRITPMAMNKVVDFKEDEAGNQVFKYPQGFKAGTKTPVVRVLQDDGNINENGSLGFITGNGVGDMNKYGQSDGARIVMMNPDTKKTYLVSGSGQEIKDALRLIKGESKYVATWKLDNGTFVKGLSRSSGNLDANSLREYDKTNMGGGGNGFYIKD